MESGQGRHLVSTCGLHMYVLEVYMYNMYNTCANTTYKCYMIHTCVKKGTGLWGVEEPLVNDCVVDMGMARPKIRMHRPMGNW